MIFLKVFFLLQLMMSCKASRRARPQLQWSHYRGTIDENTVNVILDQPLIAISDSSRSSGICDYELIPLANQSASLPFEAIVIDQSNGQGSIQLKDGVLLLDCKDESIYEFFVVAVDCGVRNLKKNLKKKRSKRSLVTVEVVDVDEYDPKIKDFVEEVQVDCDEVDKDLMKIVAEDEDCSDDICEFHILHQQDFFFNISNQGEVFRTTNPMKCLEKDENFILSIIAVNCRGIRSAPIDVRIKVLGNCSRGWEGLNQTATFKNQKIFPLSNKLPELETCHSSVNKSLLEVEIEIKLMTEWCEEDNICEEYPELIQLTSNKFLEGSDEDIRHFDGDGNFIEVSLKQSVLLDQINLFSSYFISFEMFLDYDDKNSNKNTIICKSDEKNHNRHHFAIYVQRCHIMLLVRNEIGGKDQHPAEWHWKLSSNSRDCYQRWFHVVMEINYPNATLKLNGEPQQAFLIADDYRLHSNQVAVRWSVGAAWQGKESKYSQFFFGQLSNFVFKTSRLNRTNLLRCLSTCREAITFSRDFDLLQLTKTQKQLGRVVAVGSVDDVTRLLQNLTYVTDLHKHETMTRDVIITTKIRCRQTDHCSPIEPIPPALLHLKVAPPSTGNVYLTRIANILVPASLLLRDAGITLLNDVIIKMKQAEEVVSSGRLKMCCIRKVIGSKGQLILNSDWLKNRAMKITRIENQLIISGSASKEDFQEALRLITFSTEQASANTTFHFEVNCSAPDLISISSHFQLQTREVPTTSHTTTSRPNPILNDAQIDDVIDLVEINGNKDDYVINYQQMVVKAASLVAEPKTMKVNSGLNNRSEDYNTAPLVVTGICVVLFVTVAIAAIVHSRSHSDNDDRVLVDDYVCEETGPDTGLDWDDSAMTITVNPMMDDADTSDFSDFEEDENNLRLVKKKSDKSDVTTDDVATKNVTADDVTAKNVIADDVIPNYVTTDEICK